MSRKVWAIIPAAGRGVRLGSRQSKAMIQLVGMPLFARTVIALDKAYPFEKIILVVSKRDKHCIAACVSKLRVSNVSIVEGGVTRAESVRNGMLEIGSRDGIVLIHDMARPFVDKKSVRRAIKTAREKGACILAQKCTATVKEVSGDGLSIRRTLDREKIYLAQTPQVFKCSIIKKAYSKIGKKALRYTDEASLVENLPHRVWIEPGSAKNLKITNPEDMILAELFIKQAKG